MFDKNRYKPMLCPVCKSFYFDEIKEDLADDEILQCSVCGWIYDCDQQKDPNLAFGENSQSLNAYRKTFKRKRKKNRNYNYLEENYKPEPHMCPVCGKYEFADEISADICPYCGWEDDGTDKDNEIIAANDLLFSKYKKRYENYIIKHPNYKWAKDGDINKK